MNSLTFFADCSTLVDPEPAPQYVVAFRQSDLLLADAFDADVPVLGWARVD